MDFDEYDYLEKTVEGSGAPSNGAAAPRSEEKERSSRRRSGGGGGGDEERDDGERRSKRSRSEENRDRDKDKDRDRHRDRDKDRDRHRSSRERRDRDRDRDEKDREKERDKDKERRSRDREKEKEKEKEREREREKDRERRSRSRSERRRDDEERDRERYRERDYRDRDVRRRKEEAGEPEADPERDQRTVFAYQLSLKADERDVYEFFSRAGKVRDVRLIMDRNSRRSKGVGYIEFYDVMSVPMAIALSGQLLLGQQVMVKPSEAEKNLVQSNASSSGAASGGARKLYVGNLHSNITEDQLRQFARLEDAKAAQSLNGQLDIAGRVIKASVFFRFTRIHVVFKLYISNIRVLPDTMLNCCNQVSAVTDQAGVQVSGVTTGDLDDDEGGGLALNASSRALLMQKLDRSGVTTSLTAGIAGTGLNTSVGLPPASVLGAPPVAASVLPTVPGLGSVPGVSLPITTQAIETAPPSECLLLKNMFDPSVETDPDFDLDIKDDVQEECSKFGQVKHIFVDKNTSGFVYLRFDSITAAMSAQKALHGRWFAGKMITATFMSPQQYSTKFPS
uniref:RRM domain-containing protein n=1 Tax=Oryza rufipogon TaxID=4529 RepID=A0A0E0NPU2_ORYRU